MWGSGDGQGKTRGRRSGRASRVAERRPATDRRCRRGVRPKRKRSPTPDSRSEAALEPRAQAVRAGRRSELSSPFHLLFDPSCLKEGGWNVVFSLGRLLGRRGKMLPPPRSRKPATVAPATRPGDRSLGRPGFVGIYCHYRTVQVRKAQKRPSRVQAAHRSSAHTPGSHPRPRTLPDAPGPLCALLLTPFKTPLRLSFLTLVVPRERMSAVVAAGTLSRLPVPRPHPGTRPALEGAVCSELPRDRMTLVCS